MYFKLSHLDTVNAIATKCPAIFRQSVCALFIFCVCTLNSQSVLRKIELCWSKSKGHRVGGSPGKGTIKAIIYK